MADRALGIIHPFPRVVTIVYGGERVYSFTAPTTGIYSIQVTSASGYVDYMWKAGICNSTGWECIDDISVPGKYGSMSWTAGTTYYILLDDENTTAGSHTFYINEPEIAGIWLGTTNSNWHTASNWTAGIIPDASIDVVIPGGTTYQPLFKALMQNVTTFCLRMAPP